MACNTVLTRYFLLAVIFYSQRGDDIRITYDPRQNVGYLHFHETRSGEVETIHISDELNIDLASDGTVYGIELLNANEQLRGDNVKKLLVFVNEATGERFEYPPAD